MKISIITINYNNLSGLKKTRDSIIHQTYKDYEWIVIDGGSTDGAKEFLQEHSNEMSYWCSEKDDGVYNAQNKGIALAKGDYVICMNSGDTFHDENVLKNVCSQDLTADVIYGDWMRVYPDGREEKKNAPKEISPYFFFYDNICHQAMFVKTSVMQNSPFDETYKVYADWSKWQELLQKGCSFYNAQLVVCDFEAGVGLSEKNFTLCIEERNRMHNEQPDSVKKNIEGIRKELKEELAAFKSHIEEQNKHIENLEKIRVEQQTAISELRSDNEIKQRGIDNLKSLVAQMGPVFFNKYANGTYQLVTYKKSYANLINLNLKLLNWLANSNDSGRKFGGVYAAAFSYERYKTAYPDVQGDALQHYINVGVKEDRFLYLQGDMGKLRQQPANDMPLISIVVTSYNYAHFIRETLDSLISQTYKNIEIIVIDDGSKDNSVEVISEYVNKYDFVHLFTHPNNINRGLPESMRLGIENAKGEYVAFCESDDYIREDYVQKKVDIINRYEDVGIISNAIKMFGDEKDIEVRGWVCQHIRKLLKSGGTPVDMRYNQEFNFIPTLSSVMIRRDILMSLDYNTPIPAWIDYWLYRQILIKYMLYFVDEELTFWRQHESYNGLENSSKVYGRLAEFLKKSNRLLGL